MDQKQPEFFIVKASTIEAFANTFARMPWLQAQPLMQLLQACEPYTPPAPEAKPEAP
jgi:hypothetical protein